MTEKDIALKNYIDAFKQLDIKEKREEYITSLKELLVIFEGLAEADNITLNYIKNNEILDLNKENVSEDDFLEAAMVYLEVSKDIIGQYISKKDNL